MKCHPREVRVLPKSKVFHGSDPEKLYLLATQSLAVANSGVTLSGDGTHQACLYVSNHVTADAGGYIEIRADISAAVGGVSEEERHTGRRLHPYKLANLATWLCCHHQSSRTWPLLRYDDRTLAKNNLRETRVHIAFTFKARAYSWRRILRRSRVRKYESALKKGFHYETGYCNNDDPYAVR